LKNKIALEEHFAIDLTIDQSKIYSQPVIWERLKANLLDIEQQRLERMEEGGTAFLNPLAQFAGHPGHSKREGSH
jgi:hypothetical protein